MNNNIKDILKKYSSFTYYTEARDERGELIFCTNQVYDGFEVDEATKYIALSNSQDSSVVCLLQPMLQYTVKELKNGYDKITFYKGNNKIKIFAKKY